ncbi:MAG: c-type cytochrome [Comamonas sp.]|uniref:c-type cytochrome n=1 Tax=Comamonas sp. TaxID=34028 RepID=UPI002FC73AD9
MKSKIKYSLLPVAAVLAMSWHLASATLPAPQDTSAPQIIDGLPANYAADLTTEQRTFVERGRYIARLGDCVACHTGNKAQPMAGGLALETPFGKLYSTNITPDTASGIGGYSFEQFDKAMRKGVAADGRNLYPAMPYPSYAKMTADDMQALYAYLMEGVAPIAATNKASEMGFPFNQRWGLSLWNWMFLESETFTPQVEQTAEWNRGAYLVQGLGHCGACHTPRGVAFQEKTMMGEGKNGQHFLAGETVEGWRALSLRDLWTPEETAELLKTGRNSHGTVSGNMVDVVQHSTQYMTDGDLLAIGTYLKSLPAGKNDLPMQVSQGPAPKIAIPARATGSTEALTAENAAHYDVPADLYSTRGGLGYLQFCADCHRSDGGGVKDVFPSLQGNRSLLADNPSTLVHIMLTGWTTPVTQSHSRALTMPAFTQLSDQEIADILNFARRNWGSKTATEIKAKDIASQRKPLNAQPDHSRPFETLRLANMLNEKNAEQLIYGARLNIETRDLLPKNVGNALNCASCHLNAGTVADGSPYIGISAFFPGYAPRAGRTITLEDRINGCFLRSMNGKPLPLDSDELKAMVALFDWMRNETKPEDKVEGRGVGKVSTDIIPNAENGKKIYSAQCALCHGSDGEGIKNAKGQWVYPPLWGDESFNIGAGMARTYTAAAFVKRNMPIAMHNKFPLGQGGMTDQEAVDVAEYFSHQPRPDFAGKVKDWPNGKKPADARY